MLILIVILLPKFDIVTLGMAGRSLRFFDIYASFCMLYIAISMKSILLTRYQIKFLLYLMILIFISLVGLLYYSNEHDNIRLLSIVRMFQYAAVFIVITQLSSKSLDSLILSLFYCVLFLVGLDYFNSIETRFSGRASGLFAGPWEAATILGALYIGSIGLLGKNYSLVTFLGIFLTESRTQLVAFFLSFLSERNIIRSIFSYKVVLLIATAYFAFNMLNVDYVNYSKIIPTLYSFMDVYVTAFLSGEYVNFDIRMAGAEGDFSLLARFNHWSYYLSDLIDLFPLSIIIGIGANGMGLTNDSLWIKSIVDFGLVAVTTSIIIYWRTCFYNQRRRQFFIFLFITGFMFDFIWSYKIAVVLFLVDRRLYMLTKYDKN